MGSLATLLHVQPISFTLKSKLPTKGEPVKTVQRTHLRQRQHVLAAAVAAALLAACGGGDNTATPAATDGTARALAVKKAEGTAAVPALAAPTATEAQRFLGQATFGAAPGDRDAVIAQGFDAWIDAQWLIPATSHRAYWENADATRFATQTPPNTAGQDQVWESFWKQAATGPDQLRQRVAYALSQIFVISAVDSNVGDQPRAVAAWLDMLGTDGLTTYRRLLESVSLHPMMGRYLTHLGNQKANTATGRVPDENYAREVMQLFSIGVVQLNADGTPVLVNNKPVESYTPADVAGLAKVFTGFSWACPGAPSSNNCFFNGSTGGTNSQSDPDRQFKPMVGYPAFHSTEAKSFLGASLPAQTTADPAASLKFALDTLAAHPNTGPFMSRLLIQRLTSSNPSPAYVRDVAAVFANNGAGVRGDMKAVVKAILVHPEARLITASSGKLREPVLRLSAYLRAFPHTSDTGFWKVGNTDSNTTALGQTPLRAPSVFNFYRPGYVAPGTRFAAAGLVAPEMQILNESSAAGWVNYMRDNLNSGVGQFNGTVGTTVFNRRDLQRDWSAEIALADQPTALAANVVQRLIDGKPSEVLIGDIAAAIGKITIPTPTATNQAAVTAAKRNRVNSAVLLTLASPDFLVQQ